MAVAVSVRADAGPGALRIPDLGVHRPRLARQSRRRRRRLRCRRALRLAVVDAGDGGEPSCSQPCSRPCWCATRRAAEQASGKQQGLIEGLRSIAAIAPALASRSDHAGRLRDRRDGAGPLDRAVHERRPRLRRGIQRPCGDRHGADDGRRAPSCMAGWKRRSGRGQAAGAVGNRRDRLAFALLAAAGSASARAAIAVSHDRRGGLHLCDSDGACARVFPDASARARHDLPQFPVHRRSGAGPVGFGLVHRGAAAGRVRCRRDLRQSALGFAGLLLVSAAIYLFTPERPEPA